MNEYFMRIIIHIYVDRHIEATLKPQSHFNAPIQSEAPETLSTHIMYVIEAMDENLGQPEHVHVLGSKPWTSM